MGRIYRPIQQLPYCCVPATIQWILYRKGYDILDQELIGVEFGLRIPQRLSKYFQHEGLQILADDAEEFGTQTRKYEKYSINSFFRKFKIPLEISQLYTFNNTNLLQSFLIEALKGDNDIILSYNDKIFDPNQPTGHFSLLVNIESSGEILIGDPAPPFFKRIHVKKMIFAMSDKIDAQQRGIYLISNVEKTGQKH